MTLAVRNDTLGSLVDTDGDYSPLQVNASGALFVEAALSATDNAVLDSIATDGDNIQTLLTAVNVDHAANKGYLPL